MLAYLCRYCILTCIGQLVQRTRTDGMANQSLADSRFLCTLLKTPNQYIQQFWRSVFNFTVDAQVTTQEPFPKLHDIEYISGSI